MEGWVKEAESKPPFFTVSLTGIGKKLKRDFPAIINCRTENVGSASYLKMTNIHLRKTNVRSVVC
ncbi:hypothetical protein [Brevibacillus laterosporus]|uniref:hypothetical protein n=1 Tax=Brevibacillus laterosporus TaxID=1465 RepID=UPI00265CC216|nr:hypothetical protein [Brevibacillus laterosporus]